jgi:cobalt/nickel transport system permease protein
MTIGFDTLNVPDSPLARLDPRWKLVALTAAVAVAGTLRSVPILVVSLVLAVALVLACRLPWRLLAARYGAFGLFLLPFAVILPIVQGWDGVLAAARVGARAGAVFSLALVLVGTAPFHRTLQAAQALRAPRLLTQIALMSYRYVFVLGDEFLNIRTAMRVRGFRAGTNRHTYRTFGYVAGALLLRGEERAQRVAQAMRCRGFDGRFRTLHGFHTRWPDLLFFAAAIGISTALLAGDWFLRS